MHQKHSLVQISKQINQIFETVRCTSIPYSVLSSLFQLDELILYYWLESIHIHYLSYVLYKMNETDKMWIKWKYEHEITKTLAWLWIKLDELSLLIKKT